MPLLNSLLCRLSTVIVVRQVGRTGNTHWCTCQQQRRQCCHSDKAGGGLTRLQHLTPPPLLRLSCNDRTCTVDRRPVITTNTQSQTVRRLQAVHLSARHEIDDELSRLVTVNNSEFILLLLLLFITHKMQHKKHTSYKYSIQVKQTKKEKCNQRIKPQ